MLRSVSQPRLISPKQQRKNTSFWERRVFIKLGGFYGGLSCQLYIQLMLPSTRGTCISKRQGKTVSLSIPLSWVITALCPRLLPSRRISITGSLGWEFQNELIKTEVMSAAIMSYSNAKPLRLAWIRYTPIWAYFVPGVMYCETVRHWAFASEATGCDSPSVIYWSDFGIFLWQMLLRT